MPVISVAIQKGGSGKTTTTINLGAALHLLGKRVLLIDADPQGNLSQSLGVKEESDLNLYSEIKKEIAGQGSDITKAIVEIRPGFSMVPASLELADAELELVSVYSREQVLSWIIKPVRNKFDFIFIDCPHAIGMLTVNALVASDQVLIPLQAEFLPLKGVHSFMRQFHSIKKRLNPGINLLGFVLTKYDERKKMNQHVLEELENEFGQKVFNTHIRTCIGLAKAQEAGVDIFSFERNSNAAIDYAALAKELLEKLKR